jgi:hypothetical protein
LYNARLAHGLKYADRRFPKTDKPNEQRKHVGGSCSGRIEFDKNRLPKNFIDQKIAENQFGVLPAAESTPNNGATRF